MWKPMLLPAVYYPDHSTNTCKHNTQIEVFSTFDIDLIELWPQATTKKLHHNHNEKYTQELPPTQCLTTTSSYHMSKQVTSTTCRWESLNETRYQNVIKKRCSVRQLKSWLQYRTKILSRAAKKKVNETETCNIFFW